jgi:general secretion pathway protein K
MRSRSVETVVRTRLQQGIALVLVMWVLSLLTVIALALTQVQRTESSLTANQLDSARFRAQADALINLVVLNLLGDPPSAFDDGSIVWNPDGIPRDIPWDGERFSVALSSETSKFDLNTVTKEQLLALIGLTQPVDTPDAALGDQLADAILDWRDENNLSLLNGAEDSDYEAAGLPYGAADGPFKSVEELQQVLGMTPMLYARLAPNLTVSNDVRQPPPIDESFASPTVLAALNGYTLEEALQIVEERSLGLFDDPEAPQATRRQGQSRGGPRYHLRINRATRDSGGMTMEAVISIDPANRSAFDIVWRRYGYGRAAAADDEVSEG